MKTLKSSLFAIAVLFVTISVQSQTADEIINKYIDVIGGREAISKIKSLHIESETWTDGNTVTSDSSSTVTLGGLSTDIMNLIVGKGWKNENNFMGTKNFQCVTDSGGWNAVSIPGVSKIQIMTMPKDVYEYKKINLQFGGLLINYAANGYKVELVGKETLDSCSVYNLKLTDTANRGMNFYIDANTYYLLKTVTDINQGKITATFSDYQKTDIGLIAFHITTLMPPATKIFTTLNKVVINPEIDPKIFDKPEDTASFGH